MDSEHEATELSNADLSYDNDYPHNHKEVAGANSGQEVDFIMDFTCAKHVENLEKYKERENKRHVSRAV